MMTLAQIKFGNVSFSFIHVSVTTRNEVSSRFFKKRDSCSCLLFRLLQFIYQNLGNSDFLPHPPFYFSIVYILSKFDGPGFLSMSPHFCRITTTIISRYFMLNISNHSKKFLIRSMTAVRFFKCTYI